MKRTSTYKMSKALKTSLRLGRYKDKDQRAEWKKAMVNAEIYANSVERVMIGAKNGND